MHNKGRFFLMAFSVCSSVAFCQTDTLDSKTSWFVSLHAGALFAETGLHASPSFTLMQGVKYGRLSLGVGVGYDLYEYWRTLPIFAGAACDILRRSGTVLYVQLNTGYAKAWDTVPEERQLELQNAGGYFFHPFLGYRIKSKKASWYFSAGYKMQRLGYEQNSVWSGWHPGLKTTVVQDMQRISIQLGIGI